MQVTEIPDCCALQIIHQLYCLGEDNAFSEEEASKLPKMLGGEIKPGNANKGFWVTSSIALVSEEEEGKRHANLIRAKLRAAGMHLICTFPGGMGGNYKIEMWGTKNMEVVSAIHRSRSKGRVSKKAPRSTPSRVK